MSEQYDADYFLRGQELGISGYTDYHWMPDLTILMVRSMIIHLGITPDDIILDYGCARGYVVKAFRDMEYAAYGYDISKWAVDNADRSICHHLTCRPEIALNGRNYDWIIAKDVLEHVETVSSVVSILKREVGKGIFAIVPLSSDSKKYDVPEYEKDVTHIHRKPLQWWAGLFHQPGWSVEARYKVKGIKDNYSGFPTGNGFITARRIKD